LMIGSEEKKMSHSTTTYFLKFDFDLI